MRVLPSLENILYGANLSNILSANKFTVLDVVAWFPYGISHFGAPVICSALLFAFGPPGTLPVFSRTFGYMNLAGVIIQLVFPCSAPWYEDIYGFAPADYSMKGSPAGLAAIDELFGIDMYTSSFSASPLVFGAFPSLHAACASLEALFMSHVFPKLRLIFIIYVLWICWATMYLSHHYVVDLIGGSIRMLKLQYYFIFGTKYDSVAASVFLANTENLPQPQNGRTFRWEYNIIDPADRNDHSAISCRDMQKSSLAIADGIDRNSISPFAFLTEARNSTESRYQVEESSVTRVDINYEFFKA